MKQLLLVLSLSSVLSFALQLPLPRNNAMPEFLPDTFTPDFDFTGIVGLSNCSGSLLKLETSSDNDLALVMTNGHCVESGFPAPGTFIYEKPSTRSLKVFGVNTGISTLVAATKIVYATMTKSDVTLYRVNATYKQIKDKAPGIEALTLSSQHATPNTNIEVISGYWKLGYRCHIDGFVYNLKEAGWTWEDSIRYSKPGCEVIHGTSGSPIVEAGTRKVIGINNTGNDDGEKCTMNNPCEVDEKGNVSYQKGTSYGQQTYWIYSCLNKQNQFDPNVPGCKLPH